MKINYCPNCGVKLEREVKFCSKCGTEVLAPQSSKSDKPKQNTPKEASSKKNDDFNAINKQLGLENNQETIVKRSYIITAVFGIL
ncbi:MAG: Unknown protein, partial [uncultured Sulfurovum sp.]